MKLFNFRMPQLLALAFCTSTVFANPMKVGLADLQRALQESKRGKSAKDKLEKEFQDRKKKIDSDQAKIKKESEDFQKKAPALSEKARAEQGMKIQESMAKWQEFVQKSQAEIQSKEQELTRPILDGLRTMVSDVARRRGLDVVYEANTSGILFAIDKTDITDELIKLYDEKNP